MRLQVVLPDDVRPGDELEIEAHGKAFTVTVPDDCLPGEEVAFDIPSDEEAEASPRPDSSTFGGSSAFGGSPLSHSSLKAPRELVITAPDLLTNPPELLIQTEPEPVKKASKKPAPSQSHREASLRAAAAKSEAEVLRGHPEKSDAEGSFQEVETVEVAVPEGCNPGDEFVVTVDGEELTVVVPEGHRPGTLMEIE
ncbi:unnamed protein product, partial [Polarella glacialis]